MFSTNSFAASEFAGDIGFGSQSKERILFRIDETL